MLKKRLLLILLIIAGFFYNASVQARIPQIGMGLPWEKTDWLSTKISSTRSDEMADTASQAVVSIISYRETPMYGVRQTSLGSGFFITSDGYLLTNKHVVADERAFFRVNFDGESEIPAYVIYKDPDTDLAVVKIDGDGYPTIPLGNSSDVGKGSFVMSIGNAMGIFTDSVSTGNITALNRKIYVEGEYGLTESLDGMIESNARLYPGDSGGPLLDIKGEAVGINTAIIVGEESISYSIPVEMARQTLTEAQISF